MTAYLFPGQGSQFVGMAADLYESFPSARAIIDAADDVLGIPLSSYMFGKDISEEEASALLARTDITQPALYVHSLAAWEVLKESADPASVAGHSLGEYSALAAAGALSFEDGLRTVRRRGELMANADSNRAGTMAAIIGLDDDVVEEICEEASDDNIIVRPANYNSPGQVVISGDVEAVERAMGAATEKGARRAIRLVVGGAFHSPLMQEARAGLAETLGTLTISAPSCPVYMNVTGSAETDPENIRKLLLDQLLSPVRWTQIIQSMHAAGMTSFVEVGAGKVLSGLVRRTAGRDVDVAQAGKISDTLFETSAA